MVAEWVVRPGTGGHLLACHHPAIVTTVGVSNEPTPRLIGVYTVPHVIYHPVMERILAAAGAAFWLLIAAGAAVIFALAVIAT